MHNVSQEHAAQGMPLAASETTSFWRDGRFDGMECLSATFLRHEYSPHSHDTFSIGAIEYGSQISTINGTTAQTGPGTLYLINPGEVHDGAPGGLGYRYRMIYPDIELMRAVIEDVNGRVCNGSPSFSVRLPYDPAVSGAFHTAHVRLETGAGALEADEGMFRVLTGMVSRYGGVSIRTSDHCDKTAAMLARDYLMDNYETDIGLEELARVAGVSRAHLIRVFRKEFYITPHAFLTDVRVRKARVLLRAGATPASVAVDCGFADQAHFARHFKARTGITPGQFRAAQVSLSFKTG